MTPTQYGRLHELFLAARDLSAERRAELLDQLAQREPGVRAELVRLLAHDALSTHAQNPLAQGAGARVLAAEISCSAGAGFDGAVSSSAPAPANIGRYAIIRQLGQGGMGVVYEAEQDDPKRRVALKVIRQELASPHLVQRFHREAQLLGRLRHRGIAQIYDAQTAPLTGEPPYFVMELIDGPPLLKFAERARLDTRQRLELIAEICDALDHAHQRGLVHRDLKPGNILVEPRWKPVDSAASSVFDSIEARIGGQPKILDFGIARDTDVNTLTDLEPGRLLGTVPYMSPEQAAGRAVDVRSDVYSVGVILFELLVGRLPYDLAGRMAHEAARIIHDEEPARLGAVDRRLRGDIEVITAKALEKSPDRRYASAAELAADIRRHLSDQPVIARAPSPLYRIRKLVRRRQAVMLGSTIAVLAALLAATISVRQSHATRVADAQRERQKLIADEEVRRTYRGAIVSAAAALENQDPALAARFLRVAESGRDTWEHRYLAARLAAYGPLIETAHPIVASALCADADALVTANAAGRIEWWHGTTGAPLGSRDLSEALPGPAAFDRSADRLIAASGPAGADVAVWDARTGRAVARLVAREISAALERNFAAPVTALAVSPDGEQVILGAGGGVLWRPRDGVLRDWLCGMDIACLAFSADGTRFVAGFKHPDNRRTAYVLAFDAGRAVGVERRIGIPYRVLSLAVPDDGATALIGTGNNNAKFATFATARKVRAYGPEKAVSAVAIDPIGRHAAPGTTHGDRVAIGSAYGRVAVHQRRSRALLRLFAAPEQRVSHLEFSPDGARLLATADRFARVYHVDPIDAFLTLGGHTAPIASLAFANDGRLVSVGGDGALRSWCTRSGDTLCERAPDSAHPSYPALSASATLVGTSDDDEVVRLRDAETAAVLGEFHAGAGARTLAISPDGAWLATLDPDRLTVWETASRRPLWHAPRAGANPGAAAVFSRTGEWLAACVGGNVWVWEVATGRPLAVPAALAAGAGAVAFSPDSQTLVAGLRDGALGAWNRSTGVVRTVATGQSAPARAIAFAPDGARLACGFESGAVAIVDAWRAERVLTLEAPGAVTCLAFSRDGLRLASGDATRAVRVWSAPPAP